MFEEGFILKKIDFKKYNTELDIIKMDNKEYTIAKGHIAKLNHKEKLKLYKFIHKKFWCMNVKELHEMEEEFGEESLIDCFNELMSPLTKLNQPEDDGEDAYRELMLDLDPDNVHIEEEYVMRSEDDEEEEKLDWEKIRLQAIIERHCRNPDDPMV
tara:strand:+ start:1300 stop:1767 length:468 start_codon:yes stop_codon:yes gene_type:complete